MTIHEETENQGNFTVFPGNLLKHRDSGHIYLVCRAGEDTYEWRLVNLTSNTVYFGFDGASVSGAIWQLMEQVSPVQVRAARG